MQPKSLDVRDVSTNRTYYNTKTRLLTACEAWYAWVYGGGHTGISQALLAAGNPTKAVRAPSKGSASTTVAAWSGRRVVNDEIFNRTCIII